MMLTRLLASIALAVTVGACGKAEDKPGGPAGEPTASPGDPSPSAGTSAQGGVGTAPAGKEIGRCKIDVTGDVTASAESVRHGLTDAKVSFGSDHWMTDDELKTAMRVMVNMGDEGGDKDAKVAEAMKKDPRLFLFILNCGAEKLSLSLIPGNDSKYADVPKAPKKYVITSDAKAGEFNVMLQVGDAYFGVKSPGTLDITRFDSSKLEGTFAFDGEERFGSKRSVKVAGSFAFDCVGSQSCGK
jgi:hypothetical protein